jgi:serine/threonine protein kinase
MPQTPSSDLPTTPAYDVQQLGQVGKLVRESAHPTTIGHYRILEVLGSGGMGVVYKAEQREPMHRLVALKVIKLGMDTEQVVARFESERQALAMMSHPNVAQVYDAGMTETGRPYFVMEYVGGEPITTYCDRHGLDTRQRLELFCQACEAVQHAHQKAIVHRDIKPGNILVTSREGKALVKVIDFGVAKATSQKLTERTLFTETGQLIGTPEYMSPEQADPGASGDVDTRTDIYSLGVVLYELLSGSLPFDPKTLRSAGYNEIQRIIREVDPPRPSTRLSNRGSTAVEVARRRQTHVADLTRQLRNELEWIPLKAMRKDRAERYRAAAELMDDIRAYLSNRPLRAAPESTAYRLRKFVRRNKRGVAASAAMFLLLIAGICTTTWQAIRATRARAEADDQRAQAEAVNRFLTEDLLLSASPEVARGKQVTVAEAVDRAATAVAQRFRERPLIEAAVRSTLSEVYDTLGLIEPAQVQARASLELIRGSLGKDHVHTLIAEHEVARLLSVSGKAADAERALRDLLSRAQRIAGPEHPLTLNVNVALAMTLRQQNRFDEAEPLYRKGLDDTRRVHGAQSRQAAQAANSLALLLHQQKKLAEAEPLYRESLELYAALLGRDHPGYLVCANNLASLLQDAGKLTEAEPMLRQVLAERKRVLGDEHPGTYMTINNLGHNLSMQSRHAEAEPLYREALAGRARALGEDHPETLQSVHNLAMLLEQMNRLEEAEPLARRAVEKRRAVVGPTNPVTIGSIAGLSAILEKSGRPADAEPLLAEICQPETLAKMIPSYQAQFVARLGVCQQRLGKLDSAEKHLLEGERRLRETGLTNHVRRKETLAALVTLYEKLEKPDDTAKWRAELAAVQSAMRPATTSSQ